MTMQSSLMADRHYWRKANHLTEEEKRTYRDFMESHRRVFLYGAGNGAVLMLKLLRAYHFRLGGIIVSDGQAHEREMGGVTVRELSETRVGAEDGVIVTVKPASQAEIVNILVRWGIRKEQILCQSLFFQPAEIDASRYLPDAGKTGPYFDVQHVLETIGSEEGTDKCSRAHDYLKKYEFFLGTFRNQAITLLELGVFHGDSLRMWSRYFKEAHIIGVDIDPACKVHQAKNCEVVITDLSREENLESLKACRPTVIVDDASHLWSHQIKALFMLWDALPHGGVYILEDLETSFDSYWNMGYDDAPVSAYDVLSAIAEVATSKEYLRDERRERAVYPIAKEIEHIGREIDMITFIHGSCIMIKA